MNRFKVFVVYESSPWSKWRIRAIDSKTGRVSPDLSWHRVKEDAEKQAQVLRTWLEATITEASG